jgi:hypothetical protein
LRSRYQVVGIATETPRPGQGLSLDLLSLMIRELSAEQVALARRFQNEFGFFKTMRRQQRHEEEYPA